MNQYHNPQVLETILKSPITSKHASPYMVGTVSIIAIIYRSLSRSFNYYYQYKFTIIKQQITT